MSLSCNNQIQNVSNIESKDKPHKSLNIDKKSFWSSSDDDNYVSCSNKDYDIGISESEISEERSNSTVKKVESNDIHIQSVSDIESKDDNSVSMESEVHKSNQN